MNLATESHVDEVFDIGVWENTQSPIKFDNRSSTNEGGFVANESFWQRFKSPILIGDRRISESELIYIRNFFYARRGKAISFLWRDYTDCTMIDVPLLTGFPGNTQTVYQANRVYTDPAGFTYQMPCDRFIPGTVTVRLNGVTQSASINNSTGQITFLSSPQSGTYLISFKFYKIVRFDNDGFNPRLDAYDPEIGGLYTLTDLSLKEVFSPSVFPVLQNQSSFASVAARVKVTVDYLRNPPGQVVFDQHRVCPGSNFNIRFSDSIPFYFPVLGVYLTTEASNASPSFNAVIYLRILARIQPGGDVVDKILWSSFAVLSSGSPGSDYDPLSSYRISNVEVLEA